MKKEQAEAARLGGESEDRFDAWWVAEVKRIGPQNISEYGNCQSAFEYQDAHYAPLLAKRDARIDALTEGLENALDIQILKESIISQLGDQVAELKKDYKEECNRADQLEDLYIHAQGELAALRKENEEFKERFIKLEKVYEEAMIVVIHGYTGSNLQEAVNAVVALTSSSKAVLDDSTASENKTTTGEKE